MTPQEKIDRLRALIHHRQMDAYLVPRTDPHQSEYVADYWQARAWLSGFSGSAGILIVTQEEAGLWTDSRYHIRAAQELAGSGIALFKAGLPGVPTHLEWLQAQLPDGGVLGFDGALFSVKEVARLKKVLGDRDISLAYDEDLVGQIWLERPSRPDSPIFLLDEQFAGESRVAKLDRIRAKITGQEAQAQLLTMLDDIAWTLNIRGSDVPYNPVAISYALVLPDEVRFFIDPAKVPADVQSALAGDGVNFSAYEAVFSHWSSLPPDTVVLIDPDKTSHKLKEAIAAHCRIKAGASIPRQFKVVKNETELAGIRASHLRDGAAVVRWLAWLERHLTDEIHTEITLADRLTRFRQDGDHFQGLSFGTIAGYQANAAIGHYSPRPETTPVIQPEGIFLIDSGGHYLDGTTDITRTIALSPPTAEEKRIFTLVLKGLIRLSQARFPAGTTGEQLELLAREPLWAAGLNCRHGIGHGMGHFLNVHEGPPGFGKYKTTPLAPGMVLTNEPGLYFEGQFGVRLENVLVVIPAETTEFGDFYGFETVTLCPFDLALVERSMLAGAELAWLNDYHQRVYAALAPALSGDEQGWLRQATRPLT